MVNPCTVLYWSILYRTHTHIHTAPGSSLVWTWGRPVDSWCNPSHRQRNFAELNCSFYYFQSKITFSKNSLPLFTRRTSQIAFCCNITVQTCNTVDCQRKEKTHTTKKITLTLCMEFEYDNGGEVTVSACLEVRAAWLCLNPTESQTFDQARSG